MTEPAANHGDDHGGSFLRAALVAGAVALLVYVLAPLVVFRGAQWGLVNYDDPYLTGPENPVIGRGLLGGLGELLLPRGRPFGDAWLPLYYASLGIDHALFGSWWFGWHLHSALLHALGAALVVLIGRDLGLRRTAALAAGVVFAAHPAATESVAWIASRKDQLSFVWAAAAALAYLRGVRSGRAAWHVAGAACLAVGLAAKGTVLVLPLLLVVHALLLRRDGTRGARLLPVAPYAAVALVLTGVHMAVARSVGTAGEGTGAGLVALLTADVGVLWLYARALLVPWPGFLAVEHGVDPFAHDAARLVGGVCVFAAWVGGVAYGLRRRPALAAVLLAVACALAPFNNVLPRTSVLFAERYAYVALLPLALGAGALAAARLGRAAPFVAAALLGTLATVRLGVWGDSVALWEDARDAAPTSAFVQMQLADAYAQRARDASADPAADVARAESAWRSARSAAHADLERAERSGHGRPHALAVRAVQADSGLATFLLVTVGGRDDARARVEESLALATSALDALATLPHAAGADDRRHLLLSNRAAANELLQRRESALEDWRAASMLRPKDPRPLNALARLHALAGRTGDALEALKSSAAAAPDDAVAARERAEIRLALGDAAGAKRDLATAVAAHPDDADLLLAAARLDMLLLRPLDAEGRFRRALELRPDDAEARTGLASALVQQAQAYASRDDVAAARDAARRAAEVAPESSAPDQILGIVARRAGGLDEAIRHFRGAYARQPDGPRIREALASVLVERAAAHLDAGEDAPAQILLEEAVAVHPERVTTAKEQLTTGVAEWPAADAAATSADVVARQAALRGLAYVATARPDEALRELRIATAGSTRAPALRRVALELLARAAFRCGRADDALAAADAFPALSEQFGDAFPLWRAQERRAALWTEAGIARRGRRDAEGAAAAFREARAALEAARAAGLAESRAELRRGEILFAEEEFVEATRAFDQAAAADPTDPEPLLDRAAVWRSHFLLEEDDSFLRAAEEDLRRALAVAPSDARAMAAIGDVLVLERKPSEAFPWLQRAVLADPSQAQARALLAELLVRAGRSSLEKHAESRAAEDLDEAESASERALALEPPTPDAWIFRADVLRARGSWDAALAAVEEAVQRFPQRAEARDALAAYWRDVGHGYLLKRRDDSAIEAFRRALAVEDTTLDLAAVRERLYGMALGAFKSGVDARKAGDIDTAVTCFRRCLRADDTPEGWFQLGDALATRDDDAALREAADAYAHAVAARPDFAAARLNGAALLLRIGRPEDAAAWYRAWLESAPADDEHRAAVERQLELCERIIRELDEEFGGSGEDR